MSSSNNGDIFSENPSGQWLRREEIVREVTEGHDAADQRNKVLVIARDGDLAADAREIAGGLDIKPESKAFSVLKKFCDKKKSTEVQARALMQRCAALGEEHVNFLARICDNETFSAQDILDLIPSLKKLAPGKLLLLHGFTGLKGAGPMLLERFFIAAIPQVDRKTAGQEAIEEEMREKAMTPIQIDVFYNICTRLPDIAAGTALALLPKVRALKGQHARVLKLFLKKDACFDAKPITNQTILGLVNLWLSLPEIKSNAGFETLMKKLSRQPDAKKSDFKFLAGAYKAEAEKEKDSGPTKITSAFRRMIR